MSNSIVTNNTNTAIGIYDPAQTANMAVKNCLFFNNAGGIAMDLNYGTTFPTVSSLSDILDASENITGNPNFASDRDFHLLGNSAAIDMGLATLEDVDLDGLPRQIDGDQNGSVIFHVSPLLLEWQLSSSGYLYSAHMLKSCERGV